MAVNRHRCTLVISDQHEPYGHPDAVPFLSAVKEKHRPSRVVHIGDETDGHAINFHEHDPDLLSGGYELDRAIERLEPVYRLFPEVDVCWSNHGSLILRQALAKGLSEKYFKPIAQIMRAPKGWTWHQDLILDLPGGNKCFLRHDLGSNPMLTSQRLGMCAVGGHHHPQFSIQRWQSPVALNWAMVVGCLIDTTSRAFAYNRGQVLRPVLGCGVIVDGQPKLEPLLVDTRGRWTGKLFG